MTTKKVRSPMPDWKLALLLALGAMAVGAVFAVALWRAHLASERRWRR